MLVDSHCHLNFSDFEEDFGDVIKRSREADVKVIQTICTKLSEFSDVLSIAEEYNNIYCSVGVHPHNVEHEIMIEPAKILKLINRKKKIIGVGETGLDYYYENSPRDLQIESFRRHIAISRQSGLPVIIHSRSADEDTAELLRFEVSKGSFPGVIHCFSSGEYLANAALECGMFISVAGIVTFKNAECLRNIIKSIPMDKLLVETDAPFLAPVPKRGRRNEPSFVQHTAEFLANLLEIETDKLANQTSKNFFSLFTRAKLPS